MESVLEYVRRKDPRFTDVSDADLIPYVAAKMPQALNDPEFKKGFEALNLPTSLTPVPAKGATPLTEATVPELPKPQPAEPSDAEKYGTIGPDERGPVRRSLSYIQQKLEPITPKNRAFPRLSPADVASGNWRTLLPGVDPETGRSFHSTSTAEEDAAAPLVAKIAAGAQRAVGGLAESIPPFALGAGVASGVPLAGRLISLGFGADMLRQLPGQAKMVLTAIDQGDATTATEALVGAGLGAYFGSKAMLHAAAPGIVKESPLIRSLLTKRITENFSAADLREIKGRVNQDVAEVAAAQEAGREPDLKATPQEHGLIDFIDKELGDTKPYRAGLSRTTEEPIVASEFWRKYLGFEPAKKTTTVPPRADAGPEDTFDYEKVNKQLGETNADTVQGSIPEVRGGPEVTPAAAPVAGGGAGEIQQAAGAVAPAVGAGPVAAGAAATGAKVGAASGEPGGAGAEPALSPSERQSVGALEREKPTPKSSTQLTLKFTDAQSFTDFAKSIPDSEVYHKADESGKEDYGIETEPHITALFGLTEHEPGPVAKAIAGHGPVTVTLGKLSIFKGKDYDVLKVDVKSPELVSLNQKLSKLPNEQTFAGYSPHLTIAYLKKGEGDKYVGDTEFEGDELTFNTLTFSPPSEIRAVAGRPELSLTDQTDQTNRTAELRAIVEGEGDASAKARLLAAFSKKHGVTLKEAQEGAEAQIVQMAHGLALKEKILGIAHTYPQGIMADMVKLYQKQPLMSARTSTSVEEQAYSTPAPLSYALGHALGVTPQTAVYDATGGNGMMLIGGDLAGSQANEINPGRVKNLRALGVGVVTENDAKGYVPLGKFAVVKLNPPFGTIPNAPYNGYNITKLEHLIALKGLEAMADDGKAAIVMGAKMLPPKPGEPLSKDAQWIFENYLYSHYRVVANFEIEGDLYAKQGAAWPVRVIVIDGRQAVPIKPPLTGLGPKTVERLKTWEQVWGKLAGARYAIDERRQAVGAGGQTGISGGAAGAMGAAEKPGDATQLPAGAIQPAAGGGQRPGKGSGKSKAAAGPAGGELDVPTEQTVSRPEDVPVPAEQPGDTGQPTARVEGGHGGSVKPAGNAAGGSKPGGKGVKPGGVSGSTAIEDELANISDEELQKLIEEGSVRASERQSVERGKGKGVGASKRGSVERTKKGPSPGKAASEAKGGIEDVWKGLGELFGGENVPSSVGLPPFNEKTWAKAKPLLESGWEQFKQAGKTLKDFIAEAFRRFGQVIKPYLDRFLQQLRAAMAKPPVEEHVPDKPPAVKGNALQEIYEPHSKAPAFGTLTPANIAQGVREALDLIEEKRGNVDEYVADKLNFNVEQLRKVMSAEQIDSAALTFYQAEEGGAIVIGHETGVGKGRIGASFLWAGKIGGKVPVFVTKDPKLFSDMYDDLKSLIGGRPPMNPFILGAPEKASIKEVIKNNDGTTDTGIVFRAPALGRQRAEIARIMTQGWEKSGYDMIFLTYSQVNDKNLRQQFLEWVSQNHAVHLVMDEAHEAAGDSESSMQAAFFSGGNVKRKEGNQTIRIPVAGILNMPGTKLERGGGVLYMSATFAKRAENMPVYFRTSLSQAAQSFTQIVEAMKAGGVALQQAVSEGLAKAGQYVRVERDFTGVDYGMQEVKVANLDKLIEHVDQVTDVLSEIIGFSHAFVAAVKKSQAGGKGTALSQAQLDVTEFASVVHNQVGQLLLAAKADAVVEQALLMHRMGEKPVIALMNTMESFLGHYVEDYGIKPGGAIKIRWNELLKHALRRTLRVTVKQPNGEDIIDFASPADYGLEDQYKAIVALADAIESKFPISPIDYILQKLRAAGLNMAELTGRTTGIEYTNFETGEGIYRHFKRADKNDVVNGFNNGGHDGMLLNASGSTGLSAHSKIGFLDLRPRAMIIAQPALDISTFVQTLGRTRRTGMVLNGIKRLIQMIGGGENPDKYPEIKQALADSNGLRSYVQMAGGEERYGARYLHMVLPLQAEKRPAAVCAKKMKSLNANTTAESEGAVKVETEDILNKYGDQVVAEYLDANEEVQRMTGLAVGQKQDGTLDYDDDLAAKFTRRMQTLPDAMQKQAYDYILPAYRELIEQLKATGEYDLEIVVHKDWDGIKKEDQLLSPGTNEDNFFTASIHLQKWEVRDVRHVPTGEEMHREFLARSGSAQKVEEAYEQYQGKVARNLELRAAEVAKLEADAAAHPEGSNEKALAAVRANFKKTALQQAGRRWETTKDLLDRVMPYAGEVVTLTNAETGEAFDGLLLEVRWPTVVKFAPGAIRFRFGIHAPGGVAYLNGASFTPAKWGIERSDKSLGELGAGHGDQRYERFFVTGNPIKAYDITGGRGKVVRFASRDGETITGLQMPANWGPAQLASNPMLELINGRAATQFLRNHGVNNGEKVPLDIGGYVTVQKENAWGDTAEIRTVGAKAGKDIYLDAALRKITGDFIKRGTRWRVAVPISDLPKALDRIMAITGRRFRPIGETERLLPQVKGMNDLNQRGVKGSLTQRYERPQRDAEETLGERPPIDADDLQQLRSVINDPSTGLPPRAAELMNAFLDSPAAEKLPKIRAHIVDSLGTYQGSYFQGLVRLARGADPHTGVHEMLHALFEVLPDELQAEIERMRVATIDAMIADIRTKPEAAASWESVDNTVGTADERIAALESLKREATRGSADFFQRGMPAEAYAVSSPTEFLAHVASARFEKRVGSMVKGFWETLKEMIRSFFEAMKRGLGKMRPKQQDAIDRVLSGDFEPVAVRDLPEAGSLKEGERRRVATEVYGEPYYVFDREEITPETIEQSAAYAKTLLNEADIPAARMEAPQDAPYSNRRAWFMQPSKPDMTGEGRKLIDILKRELQSRPSGKAGQELANIIASIRINFEMRDSALHRMTAGVRDELWAMAQSEPSQVGMALQAHAGYAHDAVFVGRNIDVELGKWWADKIAKEEGLDKDVLRRILEDLDAAKAEGMGEMGGVGGMGDRPPGSTVDELTRRNEELEKQRDYLAKALDRALQRLSPKMRDRWGSAGKIGKRLLDLIQEGKGDTWQIFRELMIDRGHPVPSDEEIQQVKNWADRADRLRTLTDSETARANGDREEIERLLREKQTALLDEFIRLKRKIDTQWVRWTKSLGLFKSGESRVNLIRGMRDFAQGNLLLKVGFPLRLGQDILAQMVLHAPTRPLANAMQLTGGKVSTETWGNVSRAYSNALRDYLGAMRTALGAAVSTLKGTQEADRVGGVMSRISIFDRAIAKAEQLDAQGQHAAAFIQKLFAFMRHGYTVAKMLHNFQGLPAKRLELRHYVVSELRANGMSAAEAEANADEVMGSLNDDIADAHAAAVTWLEGNGIEANKQNVKVAARRLGYAAASERMRAMHLPADAFLDRAQILADTLGWQRPEQGGFGGFIRTMQRAGEKVAEQWAAASPALVPFAMGLEAVTLFSNATANLINRAMVFFPILGGGFWPAAFGVGSIDEAGIAHEGSPRFRTAEDRTQQRIFSTLGALLGATIIYMVLNRLITVRTKYPKDQAERALWEKNDWRPGQVDFELGGGQVIRFSLHTGLMVVMAPYLAAGGAVQDLLDERQKAQAKLNEEAARKGLTPGKVRPVTSNDLLVTGGAAAWHGLSAGRTTQGLLSAFSEQGQMNLNKTVSSALSTFTPGLPAFQEAMRAAGASGSINPQMASVLDFMVPLQASGAARTNVLGDKVGATTSAQRMVEVLTGGNFPIPFAKAQADRVEAGAYLTLAQSGFSVPYIEKNKAYGFDGVFRPMNDAELARYAQLRGTYFKQNLQGLPGDASREEVQGAYRDANRAALDELGVSQPTAKASGRAGVAKAAAGGPGKSNVGSLTQGGGLGGAGGGSGRVSASLGGRGGSIRRPGRGAGAGRLRGRMAARALAGVRGGGRRTGRGLAIRVGRGKRV